VTRPAFGRVLLLILVAAAGLRVGYVLSVTQHDTRVYDAAYYELQARALAEGRGFVNPFPEAPEEEVADHPPLTVFVLAPEAELPGDSQLWMRFTMVAFGLGVVALLALLGRMVAGERVGLLAGAIAAVYPNLWMNDALIMSETLATLTTAGVLIAAYGLLRRPEAWRALVLGVLCGLATLARAELALLVPAVALPAVWFAIRRADAQLWRALGATVAGAAVVVAPWVGYNLSRFEEPTFVSTNDGVALLGSNCHDVWNGDAIGLTTFRCLGEDPPGDQSAKSTVYRRRAFEYMTDHATRYPLVALARIGRLWSVFDLEGTAHYNRGEGRPMWASLWGAVMLFALVPFAIAGALVLRRRRFAVWPLVVPIVLVTLAAALVYGIPRFRAPAEPSIVVLGAVGLAALLARRWPAWAPDVEELPSASAAGDGQSTTIEASSSS